MNKDEFAEPVERFKWRNTAPLGLVEETVQEARAWDQRVKSKRHTGELEEDAEPDEVFAGLREPMRLFTDSTP